MKEEAGQDQNSYFFSSIIHEPSPGTAQIKAPARPAPRRPLTRSDALGLSPSRRLRKEFAKNINLFLLSVVLRKPLI